MSKNFNEMSFDELKCYRREGLWRSLGQLLVIILVITGVVLMEVNHVSPSNQNRFRVIGLTTVIGLFGYLKPLMAANRVMRDHPDWIKKSGFRAKIPLPIYWCLEEDLFRHSNRKSNKQMYKIKLISFKWITN